MMNLITFLQDLGIHLAGWRHPAAWDEAVMNLDHSIHIAKTAERGLFDMVFLADGNAVRQMNRRALFAASSPSDRPAVFEPVTLLSNIAAHTKRIGLTATATTTYENPYALSRRYASLDHLSRGRAGWNVVTTSFPGDSLNFGTDAHMAREDRYERAAEFVEVCKGLWDSWDADAFVLDKEKGIYLDPDRVRTLNHKGKHFSVQGPLNVARLPQRYPILTMAGQSDAGRDIAARLADCVFAITSTLEEAQSFYADMKARAQRYGRDPKSLRILPGAAIYQGRTSTEADDLYSQLGELISPEVGVEYLSKLVEHELKTYPLDGPLPALPSGINAIQSIRESIARDAAALRMSIRETYKYVLPSMGHVVFRGDAAQIAGQMEHWYHAGACDGFALGFPVLPSGIENFVDQVVPVLQRMSVFRTEYAGSTSREIMSLPIKQ